MTFTELNETMQRFDAEKIVDHVYEETNEQLADLNAIQLFNGQSAKGRNLKSYASEEYALLKNKMNPLPGYGNPDLRLTGKFYQGIKAVMTGESLQLISTDEKSPSLEKKYGADNIFGLSDPYRDEHVRENINPVFKREIEAATGLTVT